MWQFDNNKQSCPSVTYISGNEIHFVILAGSVFQQIWLVQSCTNHLLGNAVPVTITKWVFHEIKCDGMTTFMASSKSDERQLHGMWSITLSAAL